MVKDLFKANQTKNEKIVNEVNDSLMELRNDANRKQNPEKENPVKIIDIVEKILEFSKQQKDKKSKY